MGDDAVTRRWNGHERIRHSHLDRHNRRVERCGNPLHYITAERVRPRDQRAYDICSWLHHTELRSIHSNRAGSADQAARAVPIAAGSAGLEGRIPPPRPTEPKEQTIRTDDTVCFRS